MIKPTQQCMHLYAYSYMQLSEQKPAYMRQKNSGPYQIISALLAPLSQLYAENLLDHFRIAN